VPIFFMSLSALSVYREQKHQATRRWLNRLRELLT
jgi:hypothetical protein